MPKVRPHKELAAARRAARRRLRTGPRRVEAATVPVSLPTLLGPAAQAPRTKQVRPAAAVRTPVASAPGGSGPRPEESAVGCPGCAPRHNLRRRQRLRERSQPRDVRHRRDSRSRGRRGLLDRGDRERCRRDRSPRPHHRNKSGRGRRTVRRSRDSNHPRRRSNLPRRTTRCRKIRHRSPHRRKRDRCSSSAFGIRPMRRRLGSRRSTRCATRVREWSQRVSCDDGRSLRVSETPDDAATSLSSDTAGSANELQSKRFSQPARSTHSPRFD